MTTAAGEERLLRVADVAAVVGVSRAHIYHLIKQGTFPRPIALSRNCARWVHSEVQTWVHERIGIARATAGNAIVRTPCSRCPLRRRWRWSSAQAVHMVGPPLHEQPARLEPVAPIVGALGP